MAGDGELVLVMKEEVEWVSGRLCEEDWVSGLEKVGLESSVSPL